MSTNSMDDPKYVSNNVYSGIDLINDTLSGNQHIDIYDELLKRKENELFGTNYKKNTSNNNVAKLTNSDPIMNQLDLLHKWLDRHRDMCQMWNNKEELLEKLNEQWNKDNDVGGDISTSNGNKMLNTDVSIQIDMDDTKPINQFSNMDINVDTPTMDNMEDDIYYDVNDNDDDNDDDNDQPSVYDIPMDHNKVDVDVPKKVHIEMKILNNTSNGSLEQQFPISDINDQRNHKSPTPHTPKIPITRLLCECELYAPSNYDNDPQMKEVMDNFNRQTSERFREYDERMQHKRKQCKEQCEKDIQKIILKDKIEKELTEKFGALQTDIRTEDIPTCVCEKTVADKTEKVCLNCGKTMGAVAPAWGLVSGLWYAGWSQYVSAKILEEGIKKGLEEGLIQIMKFTLRFYSDAKDPSISVTKLLSSGNFTNNVTLFDMVQHINDAMYHTLESGGFNKYCSTISSMANNSVTAFNRTYHDYSTAVTEAVTQGKSNAINTLTPTTNALTTAIIASIVVIVVIVFVMLIIYLILRYRRKKKMKKKLQYIKLLEE
ncbi:hypothetical protein PFMALIP_00911 [Plasmodium falciparum MaliPS096_E11]|uniref:Plasmodium falciparum erythrocyte membrane protein 1 acidic terminal segment domain-containing protein n=1 Tax=Plasmodium falciparum MaliPS096_E11 TaxID=1036727 RepID=A0A024WVK1_PLAFA|nr:hypothetical protein PFMALIP_00911 [Plasmodium falciparum MaliPS096_E11]